MIHLAATRGNDSQRAADSQAKDCFRLVAAYDELRLSVYRTRGRRGDVIAVTSSGGATLLRFDDVSYFNRLYAHDVKPVTQLAAIERFFDGSPHGCRAVAATRHAAGQLARACERRGWIRDDLYAWMSTTDLRPRVQPRQPRFEIRSPRRDEEAMFLSSYLTAFGADPDRHATAMDNMRHLFGVPGLHFLLAMDNARPAGVGMLYHQGESALFCAGATMPRYRGSGCHSALLAARFELARTLGCGVVHSWAIAGGRSQANMERVGIRTVSTSQAWRLPPRSAR